MPDIDQMGASVEDMERALNCLLSKIVALRETPSCEENAAFEQAFHLRSGPERHHFKIEMDMIIRSPVEGALRLAVRSIGEELFKVLKGPVQMMRLARRVCSEDESNWSNRMTIIDAAWQGIGSDRAGHWR